MAESENIPPNAQMRPCWRCRECQVLQTRIQAVGNEYVRDSFSLRNWFTSDLQLANETVELCETFAQESIRPYLLKDAKDQPRKGPCTPADNELREQITQLRITIDTIVRSQLFEILDS